MRKLTDVYIYVDKRNHEKTAELLQSEHLPYGCIYFNFDNIKSWSIRERKAEKVSLSQLKRLIDTIPTREEITRLKRQISAYKTNLSLVNERCKELQRDNERLKNINLTLKQTNNGLYDSEDSLLYQINNLEKKLDIQADLIRDKNAQLEQLKQRKWYQFW